MEQFLRTRNEFAFSALYGRYTPMLYRTAYRMVANAHRAADIVQDTWVRAAENLAKFRWESSLATWLMGILINRSREEIRDLRGEADSVEDWGECAAPAPSLSDNLDLEQAVAKLARGYREVLLLHDVEGYTHEEIAHILNIESATSRSQLARARASLRARLSQRKEQP